LPAGPYAPLGPNSTFMVYREIDQRVKAFKEYVERAAERFDLGKGEICAKIAGRWKNGSPAVRRLLPDDLASDRTRVNDFLYRDDPSGYRCPLGAHARRANPRDGLPGGAEQTMRHRIIRRGMPYHCVTDQYGVNREGLAFVCFNASIENGFEFIQRNWINGGAAFGLGLRGEPQRDFMLQDWGKGEKGTKMVIPGYRPVVLDPPRNPFVKVRGCEYLFVPSRTACSWLTSFLRQR
jgi:Dyp-type peroxidase family protein